MGLKEAAQQALEALGSARSFFNGEHDTCGGCAWCDAPVYGPCEPHCDKEKTVAALRDALAEDAMQRLTDVQQEMDCYGDGNVYRGQRSRDSKTPTLTFSKAETVEPVAYVTGFSKGYAVIQPVDRSLLMPVGMALYRSPPKREPLTESFLEELAEKHVTNCYFDTLTYAREIERLHSIGGEK